MNSQRFSGKMTGATVDQVWLACALGSVLPILLIIYACCHYERPESLLGLFLTEWCVILAAWRALCYRFGPKSVAMAAIPFVVCLSVASIVATESIATYGTVWNWSDEWWYLTEAERGVQSLQSSGWNLIAGWLELAGDRPGGWTLAGWPFVLGLVGSCVSTEAGPELMHAVAVSLNAAFLVIALGLICHILGERANRFSERMLLCFFCLAGDPLVYVGEARKESILQLSLMLAFVSCLRLSRSVRVGWILLAIVGFLGVATTRVAYVPLLMFVLYWTAFDRIHLSALLKVVLAALIIACFAGALLNFQVREAAVADLLQMHRLEAEEGLGMQIYRIPWIGPFIFYAISPAPAWPWDILQSKEIATTLIRSAGSICWFAAACYVVYAAARNRRLFSDKLFVAATIMFVGIFTAVVITGDDPRYKQPANFFLAMMLFLAWCDNRVPVPHCRAHRARKQGWNSKLDIQALECRRPWQMRGAGRTGLTVEKGEIPAPAQRRPSDWRESL